MEWAIELALRYYKLVAATMWNGPMGDKTPGDCAVRYNSKTPCNQNLYLPYRMARAGARIIGVNCLFDPFIRLETIRLMKTALEAEGLNPFLMCQPLGFRTPDAAGFGWVTLPEFPFGKVFEL